MNRCSPRYLLPICALAGCLSLALPAAAQVATVVAPQVGARNFPANVQYGELEINQIPNAQLNGKPLRTAPGFRLFSAENRLIFAHTVQGQRLRVAYVIETSTQWLLTAWILKPEEIAQIPRH
ncbi:MAG: hypothetical protein ITG01_08685 [Comamonas sp.]|nr:hypothetical protein [Comamonas sp.]